ncbi:unnamed protein product [Linum trigynum]|uniref:Uncharacterized protein n=1 Tax=Linum trigynum TaxID=586398 RepID=A0AAV2GLZ4_9ROSI
MQEKGANSPTSKFQPLPWLSLVSPRQQQWRFRFCTALVFLGLLIVWNMDASTVSSIIESSSSFKQQLYLSMNPGGRGGGGAKWAKVELEPNFTSAFLSRLQAPGGNNKLTAEIMIPGLDNDKGVVELTAGDAHVLVFQAVDES